MPAASLDAAHRLARLLWHLAVDAVEEELGVAEDGVERRAELVAHVGEELRLVPAGQLQLPPLVLDLAEQARILDGQGRLGREGLEQLDDLRRELARRLADEDQAADDLVLTEERHREHRPIAGLEGNVTDAALV